MAMAHTSAYFYYQKTKFVLLTCLLPLLLAKGLRVLEKKVNNTQILKTVFNYLKRDVLKLVLHVQCYVT